MIFNHQTHKYVELTEGWDRSPSSILWAKDGKSLYLTVEDFGRIKLFQMPVDRIVLPQVVAGNHSLTAVYWAKDDLLLSQSSLTEPSIVQLYNPATQSLTQISSTWSMMEKRPLSQTSVREFWYNGYDGQQIHGFLNLPESFDESKRYPLAFLIHGGPESAWLDKWSLRWNPAVFANVDDGWVVATINPTGSTGYGQELTDAIAGNWGTKPCKFG